MNTRLLNDAISRLEAARERAARIIDERKDPFDYLAAYCRLDIQVEFAVSDLKAALVAPECFEPLPWQADLGDVA